MIKNDWKSPSIKMMQIVLYNIRYSTKCEKKHGNFYATIPLYNAHRTDVQ